MRIKIDNRYRDNLENYLLQFFKRDQYDIGEIVAEVRNSQKGSLLIADGLLKWCRIYNGKDSFVEFWTEPPKTVVSNDFYGTRQINF